MMGSDVGIKSRLSFLSCPKSFYLKEVSLKNNPKSPNIWATNKLGNQDLTMALSGHTVTSYLVLSTTKLSYLVYF